MRLADLDSTCVYVSRHGQTSLNAAGKFRGNADPPLDATGLHQAHKLATLFKPIDISCIVCSDKQRATKTAEIIGREKNLPIHITGQLRALNVGKFSGQTRTKESEAELDSYLADPDCVIPGGESLQNFRDRILPCLKDAISIYEECGIPPLLVAHSSIVHEISHVVTGDHKAKLVEPGGVLAVYFRNGKLDAHAVYKAVPRPASTSGTIS